MAVWSRLRPRMPTSPDNRTAAIAAVTAQPPAIALLPTGTRARRALVVEDDLDQAIEAALLAVAATTTPPAEN